jgi:hypothetical protein
VIFDVIGTPENQDIEDMKHEKAEVYLKSLQKKDPSNLAEMYPSASEHGNQFLYHLHLY